MKHKTVNYYRYWNARRASAKAMKKTLDSSASLKPAFDPTGTMGLVTKDEIRTLEKNEHNLLRYYVQSTKQGVRSFLSTVGGKCVAAGEKAIRISKSFITKNKKLCEFVERTWKRVYAVVHTCASRLSKLYYDTMYKYNLRLIEKKRGKMLMEEKKETVNVNNMASVMKEEETVNVNNMASVMKEEEAVNVNNMASVMKEREGYTRILEWCVCFSCHALIVKELILKHSHLSQIHHH